MSNFSQTFTKLRFDNCLDLTHKKTAFKKAVTNYIQIN